MGTNGADSDLSPISRQALRIYEQRLKRQLEAEHMGEAVAIHVDTGDYALGRTHSQALKALLARHARDGRIATLRIGPPTDSDIRLAARISASRKP